MPRPGALGDGPHEPTKSASDPPARPRGLLGRAVVCALFLAGLVAVDQIAGLALEWSLSRVRSGQGAGRILAALDHADTEVLVLGSSRAYRHVDAARLGVRLRARVYNAGCPGQGLAYAYMLAGLAIERGAPIELALVHLDPEDLLVDTSSRALVFAPFAEQSQLVRSRLARIDPTIALKLRSRSYRFNSAAVGLVRRAASDEAPTEVLGFAPRDGQISDRLAAHPPERRAPPGKLAPPGSSLEWASVGRVALDPEMERDLADLIAGLRERGARVLVFVGPRYRAGARPAPWETATLAAAQALVARAGAHFVSLDEQTHTSLADRALFYDPSHLNATGAAHLTDLLADAIVQLGLATSAQ